MKPIIVTGLDIETTGFKPEDGHRITEVGAITYKVNPETLEFTKVLTYSKLVNPGRSIPEEVQRLTNITPATVKDAPGWDLVSAEVGKILKVTDIMIAHNAAFDAPFLAYELLRLGQPVNRSTRTWKCSAPCKPAGSLLPWASLRDWSNCAGPWACPSLQRMLTGPSMTSIA